VGRENEFLLATKHRQSISTLRLVSCISSPPCSLLFSVPGMMLSAAGSQQAAQRARPIRKTALWNGPDDEELVVISNLRSLVVLFHEHHSAALAIQGIGVISGYHVAETTSQWYL
jgi:hypothetical protein